MPLSTAIAVNLSITKRLGTGSLTDETIISGYEGMKYSAELKDIENYTVDEDTKMITGISAGTTPQAFKENIIVGDSYSVVVDAHSTTGKVYTGGKLKIMQGSTVIATYTIVVTGDPSGDGIIDPVDLLRIRQHLLGTKIIN